MNKIILIGRLTRDPEGRTLNSGKQCAKFGVAVNRVGEGADFFNVVAWDKQAENAIQYLAKGRQVAVTGRVQTGSYENKGVRCATFDVIAENIEFIGNRQTSDESPRKDASMDELKEIVDDDMPF